MRVCTIVGARPQFVKASIVSRALARAGIEEILVHTGQHYDVEMSQIFFYELGVPEPNVNLQVGAGTHAVQTGEIMIRLERFLDETGPLDWILVYGDTNSTLAGALVAAKANLPLAHVEAGLRSFNRLMPEEINRIVTDHLSRLLLCPTETAVENLKQEGITSGVYQTGDVMLDATRFFAEHAEVHAPLESLTHYRPGTFSVATIHRAENTDNPQRLREIIAGLGMLDQPVLVPLHPRTRSRLEGIRIPENVEIREPVGYLAMLTLVRNTRRVLTDSGGLQKESVWLGVPCVTFRDETEWIETTAGGWNQVVGARAARIAEAAKRDPSGPEPDTGDLGASERIVQLLQQFG